MNNYTDNPSTISFENITVPIIILDIDGTFFPILNNTDCVYSLNVLRPGIIEFFKYINDVLQFKIIIWTAGALQHAENIVKLLIDNGVALSSIYYVIYRGMWMSSNCDYTKNINLLKYPLEKLTIIDDFAKCVYLTPHNALIIPQYHSLFHVCSLKDITLYYIMAILSVWKEECEKKNKYEPIYNILNKICCSAIEIRLIHLQSCCNLFIFVKPQFSQILPDKIPCIYPYIAERRLSSSSSSSSLSSDSYISLTTIPNKIIDEIIEMGKEHISLLPLLL